MNTQLPEERKSPLTHTKSHWPGSGPWTRRTALLCLVSMLAGCAFMALAGSLDVGGKKDFKVYQANAYVGSLIESPLALDPRDPNYQSKLLQNVTEVYQAIIASDPPARMAGLAEEIAAQRPDVAAVQELYTIAMAPATATGPGEFTVLYDYLQHLTDALAAKGAHYKVAVVSTESDIAMPLIASLDPFTIAWGRIIDHETILVRTDLQPGYLQTSNPQTGRFSIYPEFSLGTQTISLFRGWCSVDVFTRGERFRVICSHPNDESFPLIQKAELQELLVDIADAGMPVMIIGDLNTDPFGRNTTDSYPLIAAAGFQDAWAVLNPRDPAGGLTWGHDAALSNPSTPFVYRLDYVLYRGDRFTPTSVEILDPKINTTAPLWPSDHAAVVATFQLGKEKPLKGNVSVRR